VPALEARVTPLVDLLVETFPRVVPGEELPPASSGSDTVEEEDLEEVSSGGAAGTT